MVEVATIADALCNQRLAGAVIFQNLFETCFHQLCHLMIQTKHGIGHIIEQGFQVILKKR